MKKRMIVTAHFDIDTAKYKPVWRSDFNGHVNDWSRHGNAMPGLGILKFLSTEEAEHPAARAQLHTMLTLESGYSARPTEPPTEAERFAVNKPREEAAVHDRAVQAIPNHIRTKLTSVQLETLHTSIMRAMSWARFHMTKELSEPTPAPPAAKEVQPDLLEALRGSINDIDKPARTRSRLDPVMTPNEYASKTPKPTKGKKVDHSKKPQAKNKATSGNRKGGPNRARRHSGRGTV